MARLLFLLCLLAPLLHAADPVVELQDKVRSLIETAEPSVVAIVISTNTAYKPLTPAEKAHPGTLGGYLAPLRRTDGIVPLERDKLDLADPRNAADNLFGSGIVLEKDGRVLTNFHLLANARKIYIRYSDGTGHYANIHAADARSDLAVLKPIVPPNAKVESRRPMILGTVRVNDEGSEKASVFRGQFILAMAHPFAAGFVDGKASASWGMLSNVRRRASVAGGEESRQGLLHQYGNLLQTDARLNLGSSGGALLNLDGEMIGLLSSAAAVSGSEASGGYALPMDPIYKRIIKVLSEGREVEYGFLGVSHDGMVKDGGLIVGGVSPNTPAKAADLRERDIILSVDGRPIRELEDLYLLIGGSLAGSQITLTVKRDGRTVTLKPTLAKFAHPHATIASKRPESVFGLQVDYTSILQQQPMFIGERRVIRPGVIIRELEADTPAALKLKDIHSGKAVVITSVNGTPVRTPGEFYTAAKGAGSVRLTIANASDDGEPARTISLP